MKASFYFLVWILIYPLLDMIPSAAVHQYSFLIAFVLVIMLSWALNRAMPRTLVYEGMMDRLSMMETISAGNVERFSKRLRRDAAVEVFTSVYFGVTTVFLAIMIMKYHYAEGWFALIIFGFLAIGSVSRSSVLVSTASNIMPTSTEQECLEAAEKAYRLNPDLYAQFRQLRQTRTHDAMLPPRPPHFTLFMVFTLFVAVLCAACGLYFAVFIGLASIVTTPLLSGTSYGVMSLLYGLLATYFGVKDAITAWHSLRRRAEKS